MSAQPHLALVAPPESTLREPISPELALIDPELAERARALLDPPAPPFHDLGARPIRSVPVALEPPPRFTAAEVVPLEEILVEARRVIVEADEDRAAETAIVPRVLEVAQPVLEPAAPAVPSTVLEPVLEPAVPAVPSTVLEPALEAAVPAGPATGLQPADAFPTASAPRRSRGRVQGFLTVLVCLALGLVAGLMIADVWAPSLPTIFQEQSEPSASLGSGSAKPATPAPSFPSKTKGGIRLAPSSGGSAGKSKGAGTQSIANPAFVWVAVPKADRYEVVFERAGRVVYRAKTTLTRLELPKSWRLEGQTYRLERGRYHWTVWPLVGGKRGRPIVSSDYTF